MILLIRAEITHFERDPLPLKTKNNNGTLSFKKKKKQPSLKNPWIHH
jgi:hypothetical protein